MKWKKAGAEEDLICKSFIGNYRSFPMFKVLDFVSIVLNEKMI